MIIERSLDDMGIFADQDANMITSPWNLWSFFGNSSSPEQPVTSGSQSPRSPSCSSDSGKNWTTGCNLGDNSNNINCVQDDFSTGSTNRKIAYKGVRVKNTVKELIMQKRGMQVQQFSSGADHYPAPTAAQGIKRSVASTPSDVSSPKRLTSFQNNQATVPSAFVSSVQVPHSHGDIGMSLKEDAEASEHFLDIPDIMCDTGERPPVLLTTVQVQESPCLPQMPSTMVVSSPPHTGVVPQSQSPQMCVARNTLSGFSPLEPLPSCLQIHVSNYQPEGTVSRSFSPSSSSSSPSLGLPACRLSPALSLPRLSPCGMSFFEWQIQHEAEKLDSVSLVQLVAPDADGDTFLHIAVAQGRRALAYVLARRMANAGLLDKKEHNSQSALQVGAAANQHLIVQDLLTLGAEINTADQWGRSPLHVCAEKGHALVLKAIQTTLQGNGQQVDVEAVNYDGMTALHVAVLSHNAVLRELDQNASPCCPRSEALLQRRKLLGECVSTLLAMGASYRTKDRKSGRTALHIAAEEANVELLRLFLDQSDSLSIINEKAYNGNTVLHVASSLQGRVTQLDAVKLLMRKGADPSAKNLENEQPAQLVPEGPLGDQVRRILKGKGPQVRYSPF